MVQLSALQWPNVVGDQRIFSELIEAQVLVDSVGLPHGAYPGELFGR